MPAYEYECECGHITVEFLHEVPDKVKQTKKCAKCGKKAKKKISVPVVQMRQYSPAHPRFMRGQRGR